MKKHTDPVYIARAIQNGTGSWRTQLLGDHSTGVLDHISFFARVVQADPWLDMAARWHDLGKYSSEFQNYIRISSGLDREMATDETRCKIDHSSAGALYAIDRWDKQRGKILAYLIAGHHAGLADWHADGEGVGLSARLGRYRDGGYLDRILQSAELPSDVIQPTAPLTGCPGANRPLALSLWIRMMFSCLVDADRLDAESFASPQQAALRVRSMCLNDLLSSLDESMDLIERKAPASNVNCIRAEIRRSCQDAAAQMPGIFSLSVPTGGGKTLSSLSFALRHALKHGMNRIIYVIPYTSIIEQTADVFRKALANHPDAVLEHHSNIAPEKETYRDQLASENWDAPIIVTTSVQFFESLFAAKASSCRKIHNIAQSVIILDEAQLLPPEFLAPILDALQLMTDHYQSSLVLCTATQPNLLPRYNAHGHLSQPGFDAIREIIADPRKLYESLERVRFEFPEKLDEPMSWEAVAAELRQHPSVLCVVNRKDDAQTLWSLMPEDTLHLSRTMCGEHIFAVIHEIKERLNRGQPVRVVSTQLIEAGVDLDFPVVFRALAGLDSIFQAAGRCNREGRASELGSVHIFCPPKPAPRGLLRKAEDATKAWLAAGGRTNSLFPEDFASYFDRWYDSIIDHDLRQIIPLLTPDRNLAIQFRTAASRFKLIDEAGKRPLIVDYQNRASAHIRTLRHQGPSRDVLRKLQRYTVSLSEHTISEYIQSGWVEEVYPGYWLLNPRQYHPCLGVSLDGAIDWQPGDLIL